MGDLPFQVGQLAESRSFQVGFRGAWFRCKIREIRAKNAAMAYLLEYYDYPEQKLTWIKLYQKPLNYNSKSKRFNRELMVRPSFPPIYHESEKLDLNSISEVIVIVDDVWEVGDLVDWWTDGCYWSGRVTKILGNDKVQIDLLPPPLGEGSSYEALTKDLRPSLDWCPEKGWTVPMLKKLPEGGYRGGYRGPCARIINPANSGKIDQPTISCSQNSDALGNSAGGSIARPKQCTNGIEGLHSKLVRTVFSDGVPGTRRMDASIGNLERTTMDSNQEYPSKKMRSNRSLYLNSMSSNTIEAAVLDLEELVNRIKWLRGVLNIEVPLSGTKQPSWQFLQHHAPCQ